MKRRVRVEGSTSIMWRCVGIAFLLAAIMGNAAEAMGGGWDGETGAPRVVLQGRVEYRDDPPVAEVVSRVEAFENAVRQDCSFPCEVHFAMHRLVRVAHDENLRKIVWKRMQRQEL